VQRRTLTRHPDDGDQPIQRENSHDTQIVAKIGASQRE
jgi:hypothetical protein